jgi:hypothetical protein
VRPAPVPWLVTRQLMSIRAGSPDAVAGAVTSLTARSAYGDNVAARARLAVLSEVLLSLIELLELVRTITKYSPLASSGSSTVVDAS